MENEMIEVFCEVCKKFLIGAPEGSKVFCPDCNHWQEVEVKADVKFD